MKRNCFASLWVITLLVTAPALLGCSRSDRPKLGRVEGVVTVDGEPLANATISFKPPVGREAHGFTDKDGRYELFYIRDIKGAVVGTNTVRITTAIEEGPTDETPARRRNLRFELEREVQSGTNRMDFELSSKDARGK